jgi:hypothetical protein
LTSTAFGAAYWSQSGVVSIGPEGAQAIATKGLILPNQIGVETLESTSGSSNVPVPGFVPIKSIWHRGFLLTAHQSEAQRTLYTILDLPDDISGSYDNCVLTHLDLSTFTPMENTGYCIASNHDRVLLVLNGNAYEWLGLDAGRISSQPLLPYRWLSKMFVLPYETSFSAVKVTGALRASDCRVRIWCNNHLVVDRTVANGSQYDQPRAKVFRLPGNFRGVNWQFEITGTAPVDEFHIATSYEELIES